MHNTTSAPIPQKHIKLWQVVELAPAYGLDDKVRQALHRDALKIAHHVKYRNAGTVEFMVDKNGDYYFLEVNPRIQVGLLQTCCPSQFQNIYSIQKCHSYTRNLNSGMSGLQDCPQ